MQNRRIVLLSGPSLRIEGRPAAGAELVLGRAADADLAIADDTASRRHTGIAVDAEGRWTIRDLGSRSGTSVNWMTLDPDEAVRLRHGDRLRVGSTDLLVELPDGDGPEDRPAESSTPLPASTATTTTEDEFRTRGSLLLRLRADGTLERELGWQDFYDRYVPLIMGFARRAGARDEEAEDVAHEVMANFFRASSRFEYDPTAGRFRGYLKTATLNAMRARWRRRKDHLDVDAGSDLPIEDRFDADAEWDREWTRSLVTRALAAVREKGNQSEQSWEAFELYGRRGVPIDEVADRLGMKPDAIRQAKSRISRQVRAEIERIRDEEG